MSLDELRQSFVKFARNPRFLKSFPRCLNQLRLRRLRRTYWAARQSTAVVHFDTEKRCFLGRETRETITNKKTMIFDLRFDCLEQIGTPAASSLEAASNAETFHARLGLRPPKGIYAISLHQLVERFLSVLRKTNSLPTMHETGKTVDDARNEYLVALDAMLDAIMEHLDDLNSVIKCFFASEKDPKYKAIYGEFKKEIRPYRDHVAKIVNKIKHEQGQLRLVYQESILGPSIGYFVEGADESGVIGPDPTVHSGGHTAFSIPRDLRFHLCGIFFLASRLAQAVYRVCGAGASGRMQHDPRLISVIQSVAAIPPIFFPDELTQPFPAVRITTSKCHLTFGPNNAERARTPPNARVSVSYIADGVSTSFRVPYMAAQATQKSR